MARLEGPWQARVYFAPGGAFAYRPGEVLVAKEDSEAAERILRDLRDQEITDDEPAGLGTARSFFRDLRSRGVEVPEGVEVVEEFLKNPRQEVDEEVLEGIRVAEEFLGYLRRELDGEALEEMGVVEEFFRYLREPRVDTPLFHEEILETFVRFTGVAGTLEAIAKLNQAGVYAQVNHVLFAHTSPEPGGSGFQANPFYANPFYANPFYANPFYANPFYANPFYANPNPGADPGFQQTGRRPSSARPAIDPKTEPLSPAPDPLSKDGPDQPRIAILDTGYAKGPARELVAGDYVDVPDLDRKGYLDPVAGHGTFIAGILEQYVPGCHIEVHAVISPYGDGDEVVVGMKLDELAQSIDRPDLVNLSFGGLLVFRDEIIGRNYRGAALPGDGRCGVGRK